jgi:WD40 repeat protein
VAFSGDGKVLAARPQIGGLGPVRFYNADTGHELKSPARLDLKVNVPCLAFHPSKLQLVVGTAVFVAHGQLALIDLRTGRALWALPRVHDTAVDGLALSPDGDTIATFGRTADGKGHCVKLFDTTKGTLIYDFGAAAKGIPSSVVFSGDGKLLAALFGDLSKPSVVVWDAVTRQEIRRITDLAWGSYNSRHNLAFLADNKTLAVSAWDRHLHLFDVTTGQRVGVYPGAYGISVSDVFAVGDGQMLLTDKQTDGTPLWKRTDALPPQ